MGKMMEDIVVRLQQIANLKIGDMLPFENPNNWGPEMSALLREGIEEIVSLRKQLVLALDEIENFRRLTPGLVTGEAPVFMSQDALGRLSFREIKDSMTVTVSTQQMTKTEGKLDG